MQWCNLDVAWVWYSKKLDIVHPQVYMTRSIARANLKENPSFIDEGFRVVKFKAKIYI